MPRKFFRRSRVLLFFILLSLGSFYFFRSNVEKGNLQQSSYADDVDMYADVYLGEPKKICSITINSDDELKAFKNRLAANRNFSFTELVTEDKNWFKKACESGVQCDVLIVSGHFGGVFFSDKIDKPQTLSLAELEGQSCAKSCSGILSQPKEVYLFGCNTLADKNPDSRTPEEYLQVLLHDGMERRFAERVVEARYGPSGEENINRMKRAFPGVPVIYGFCEKAPLGAEAGPIVKRYLANTRDYFNHIEQLQTIKDTLQPYTAATLNRVHNKNLASMFKEVKRCFRQTPGVDTNDDVSNKICAVRDSKKPVIERARELSHLMKSDQRLSYIELCNDFFSEIKKLKLNEAELAVVNEIRSNPILKNEIETLLGKVSFFMAFDYAELALDLGSEVAKISKVISPLFLNQLKKGLTREELNFLISHDYKKKLKDYVIFDYNLLNDNIYWNNPHNIRIIGLVAGQVDAVKSRLKKLLYNRDNFAIAVREQVLDALLSANAVTQDMSDMLIEILYDTNAEARANAILALGRIKPTERITDELIEIGKRETNQWAQKKAMLYFVENPVNSESVRDYLAQSLTSPSSVTRQYGALALAQLKFENRHIFEALLKCLDDKEKSVKQYCSQALNKNWNSIPSDMLSEIRLKN